MTGDATRPQPDTLQALLERYRVRELKPLARLLASSLPTRKAELIALIADHIRDPDRLRQLWDALDALQQAAVAETVHAGPFDAARFRAKYGQDPDWGQSRYGELERPSALRISRLVAQGPGLLIEAQDAGLAQRTANDGRTRPSCMLAGQRHLVVPRDAESAFRRALHEMGYGVSTPNR